MARPPVDSRLQNIEKSQQKIEGMLEKVLGQDISSTSSADEDDNPTAEKLDCKCKNIGIEPESEKQENTGENSKDE